MSWTSASGGFFYHYLAYRYSSLWLPYQKLVTSTASKFIPKHAENFLYLAPSGSYTLDLSKLCHSQCTMVDIDPLLRFVMLKIVFKSPIKLSFIQSSVEDFIDSNKQKFDFICVGNFLGQKIQNKKIVIELLEKYLKDKSFFIQYDRFSFEVSADKNRQVKEMTWSDSKSWMQNWQSLQAQNLTDHETDNLFESHAKSHLLWEIRPNTFHLVELVGNKV